MHENENLKTNKPRIGDWNFWYNYEFVHASNSAYVTIETRMHNCVLYHLFIHWNSINAWIMNQEEGSILPLFVEKYMCDPS